LLEEYLHLSEHKVQTFFFFLKLSTKASFSWSIHQRYLILISCRASEVSFERGIYRWHELHLKHLISPIFPIQINVDSVIPMFVRDFSIITLPFLLDFLQPLLLCLCLWQLWLGVLLEFTIGQRSFVYR
jgi:hypothetical protein